jgi:hypothetical protein
MIQTTLSKIRKAIAAIPVTWAKIYDDRYESTEEALKLGGQVLVVVVSIVSDTPHCKQERVKVMLKAFAPKSYCKTICNIEDDAEIEAQMIANFRQFFATLYELLISGYRMPDSILNGFAKDPDNPTIHYEDLQNGELGDTAMQQVSLGATFYVLAPNVCTCWEVNKEMLLLPQYANNVANNPNLEDISDED